MLSLRLLPLAFALFMAACTGTRPSTDPDADGATMGGDSLVGTWELTATEGYPEGYGEGMEQRLTFYDDGRMTMWTQTGGETIEQEMQYRVEGDQLVQAMGVGGAVARASRFTLEGDRLTIEQPGSGQRDIYRRVR